MFLNNGASTVFATKPIPTSHTADKIQRTATGNGAKNQSAAMISSNPPSATVVMTQLARQRCAFRIRPRTSFSRDSISCDEAFMF